MTATKYHGPGDMLLMNKVFCYKYKHSVLGKWYLKVISTILTLV